MMMIPTSGHVGSWLNKFYWINHALLFMIMIVIIIVAVDVVELILLLLLLLLLLLMLWLEFVLSCIVEGMYIVRYHCE